MSTNQLAERESESAKEVLFSYESTSGIVPVIESEQINILLVDDEPQNLMALETVLDDPSYRLVRATSGNEALLALVAGEFALLVLDIRMPEMNGFELAQIIKQRRKTAAVPIIFLTAYFSEDEHILEGYSTGAVDYLSKPINATVLRSKVAVFAALYRQARHIGLANRALLAEIAERHRAQDQLRELNGELEQRVAMRTAELSESEARFRALAEEMPHLVWETDTTGRSTFQNAKWRDYTGLSRELTKDDWAGVIHPDDAPGMMSFWASSLETGAECDTICRCRRASDGAYRWFRIKAAPVRDPEGKIIRWVGTCTDVHEQRKAEKALVELDKRKDEFLAMLGHELRNPLAAIRHAVRIQGEAAAQDAAERNWANAVIDRQSAQLSRMVDDLLDVERINRGRVELRTELLALGAVLERAVEAARPFIAQKGHSFEVEITDSEMPVRGDAARLEQIFVNLLSNAAKYTPDCGKIRLAARCENSEAAVTVADSGVGIAPDLLPHVFDLFTQAQTSIDRAQGGLGIGLTVVKSLTEMHGGRVEVESGEGVVGTVFTVRLPLSAETPARKKPAATEPEAEEDTKARRVLIVDDHMDAAKTLAALLARRNCEIRIAYDGPGGIDAAHEFNPEVLLLDLGLPGLDGYEVAAQLRADARFENALFVAISGYAQESDRSRSLAAGFDYHCTKPVDLPQLLSVIRSKHVSRGS